MRHSAGVAFALAACTAAVVFPILISAELSWRQGMADESTLTLSYARDVLRRASETAGQVQQGIDRLEKANYPPCSPSDINLMRKIDLGSGYIQAVGRIRGNYLLCTSLGTTDPIPVGAPTLVTEYGTVERLVRIPLGDDRPLAVISRENIAFLVDIALVMDVPTEGPNVSLAVYVPSSPGRSLFSAPHSEIRPEWLRPIAKGSTLTFRSAGNVVTIVRSPDRDIAVAAAVPESFVQQRVRQSALIFIPFGLLGAALLGWAVTRIAKTRLSLVSVLRTAAKRREFFVEYQPIVEMETGRWIGAEALVRWRRSGGIVRPDKFIPTAEESGLITIITARVAEIVAADLPGILRLDPEFFVSINLSAVDLRSSGTIDLLHRILGSNGIRPRNVKVEATERGILQGQDTRDILAATRAMGIEVAIDDFGTGYSSLSYLGTLALDALKIDKSFVETIGTDGATSQVVPHIIGMAQTLKLKIVAEGVENEMQAQTLKSQGVHQAQGWLFGRPMPIAMLLAALQSNALRKPRVVA